MNNQDMMIAQQMLSDGKSKGGFYLFVIATVASVALAAVPIILAAKVIKAIFGQSDKPEAIKCNPYESLRHTGSLGVYSRYTSVTYSLPKPPRFDGLPGSRYN